MTKLASIVSRPHERLKSVFASGQVTGRHHAGISCSPRSCIGKSTLLLQMPTIFSQEHKVFYFHLKNLSSKLNCARRIKAVDTQSRIFWQSKYRWYHCSRLASSTWCYYCWFIAKLFCAAKWSTCSNNHWKSSISTYACQKQGIAVLLSGYPRKRHDGGPKLVEHMVDASFIYKERTVSNENATCGQKPICTVNEIGFFEMKNMPARSSKH